MELNRLGIRTVHHILSYLLFVWVKINLFDFGSPLTSKYHKIYCGVMKACFKNSTVES
jgi:hypothetical protein